MKRKTKKPFSSINLNGDNDSIENSIQQNGKSKIEYFKFQIDPKRIL